MPVAVFLLVYGPAVGHGFISDDFGWILDSRVTTPTEAAALFGKSHGFYRPLVALSFAANYATSGNRPLGYGLTNLGLCLLCAGLIALTLQALQLPGFAAAFGAAVWLLNFHGINMAILWTSGRTALLLVATAAGAVLAMLRGHVLVAVVCLALALLSKEEAVALPVMMLACLYVVSNDDQRRLGRRATGMLVCGIVLDLALYAWLRGHAGAMTPASAPDYYRFTLAIPDVLRNVAEYADRAGTFAAAVTLLAWVILRPETPRPAVRRRVVACGVIWLAGGYAVTMFLPVRSSLYACFPSIGACLIAAEICWSLWTASSGPRRRVALWAVVVIPVLCGPVYLARNRIWTDLADFSTVALRDIATATASVPAGSQLVLVDDPSRRVNLASTFGHMIGDAVALKTGRRFIVRTEWPPTDAELAVMSRACDDCDQVRLYVRDGRIVTSPR
jgi:hypothetical protein